MRRGQIEEMKHRGNIARLRITEQQTQIPYLSRQENCSGIKEKVSKINLRKLCRIVKI